MADGTTMFYGKLEGVIDILKWEAENELYFVKSGGNFVDSSKSKGI